MMPRHHVLAEALQPRHREDRKGFLFRTTRGHGALADQRMTQVDAWRMVRKRALTAGILAPIGNHSFRATGITAYLANGGALEHASPRTTKLYMTRPWTRQYRRDPFVSPILHLVSRIS
jgi:integrase